MEVATDVIIPGLSVRLKVFSLNVFSCCNVASFIFIGLEHIQTQLGGSQQPLRLVLMGLH